MPAEQLSPTPSDREPPSTELQTYLPTGLEIEHDPTELRLGIEDQRALLFTLGPALVLETEAEVYIHPETFNEQQQKKERIMSQVEVARDFFMAFAANTEEPINHRLAIQMGLLPFMNQDMLIKAAVAAKEERTTKVHKHPYQETIEEYFLDKTLKQNSTLTAMQFRQQGVTWLSIEQQTVLLPLIMRGLKECTSLEVELAEGLPPEPLLVLENAKEKEEQLPEQQQICIEQARVLCRKMIKNTNTFFIKTSYLYTGLYEMIDDNILISWVSETANLDDDIQRYSKYFLRKKGSTKQDSSGST